MPTVILFDVNGTILDTAALAPVIRKIFGRKLAMREWFTELLQYTMAYTLAGEYREFSDIGVDVLHMAAARSDLTLTPEDVAQVLQAIRQLPAYPDVPKALRRLQSAGYRLATLTNSTQSLMEAQLRYAELDSYFEHALSIEAVGKFKPAGETYRYAAHIMGVPTEEILMVAAHPWDLLGAARAGCRTAFLQRPEQALLPGAPTPDYVVKNVAELATQLSTTERKVPGAQTLSIPKLLATGLALGIASASLYAISAVPEEQKPR